MKFWDFVENHPAFQQPLESLSLDQNRRLTSTRMYHVFNEKFLTWENVAVEPRLVSFLFLHKITQKKKREKI